jgi:hypothetical protein
MQDLSSFIEMKKIVFIGFVALIAAESTLHGGSAVRPGCDTEIVKE